MLDLSLWYLLPLGVAIATIYGATGISGANFWVPVYLLLVGLEPRLAFWVGLVSMLFGSASGLAAHLQQRTVRWAEVGAVCWISVPLAIVGARLAPFLPVRGLAVAFGLFAAAYGLVLLAAAGRAGGSGGQTAADRGVRAGFGGLLVGALSVGLGALLLPAMLRRLRQSPVAASGSTLAAVFATSVAAAVARLDAGLVEALSAERAAVLAALVFAVPGVVVGGQVGPRIARRLDRAALQRGAGGVLVLVGGLLVVRGMG